MTGIMLILILPVWLFVAFKLSGFCISKMAKGVKRSLTRFLLCVLIFVTPVIVRIMFPFWMVMTAPDVVIGNLGGVPVEIPREYARFVEYDSDPHFMESSWWFNPERTSESRLRSFGFEVRYPDMASVKVQTKAEKNRFTTMWMRVGVITGEYYGSTGNESLNNYRDDYLDASRPCSTKCFIYQPLPDQTYGLTGYTPTGSGVDVEKRSIDFGRGTDLRDSNIYFFEDEAGQITTFIRCSNRTHAAAPCEHYFNLNPLMNAHIKVSYRNGLLPHWQQIQQSVTKLIYGFEADTNTSTDSQ